MSIESFDPKAADSAPVPLSGEVLQRLAQAAGESPPDFGLTRSERERFAGLSLHSAADWAEAVAGLDDAAVVELIRFFTVAEETISGWQPGSKSLVVGLARVLKGRDAYPAELTAWIKANSTNRFLPHGSLMDRL